MAEGPACDHSEEKGHTLYMKLNAEKAPSVWDRAGKTSRVHKNLGLIGCEAAPDEHEYTRSDQVKLLRTTSMRVQTLDCDQGEHNLSLTRSGSSVRRGFEDAAAAKPPTPGLPTPIPLKRSRSYLKFTPHKQLSKHEKEDRVTELATVRGQLDYMVRGGEACDWMTFPIEVCQRKERELGAALD